ncbi:MAG: decaprenyl-phosphate phosphoribosyltransferase, partial [Propionibacteriaceae bacterium]|nr:decaprenyl-phosphate phosphoribosyltransferase [Propionibacteriaceae bacterium]
MGGTTSPTAVELPTPPSHRLPAVIRVLRPPQWPKNLLVLAAPIAAGRLFEWSVAGPALAATIAFTLISAAIYVINDLRDAEADRNHPRKRFRPIAAGELSRPAALVVLGIVTVAGFGLALWIGWPLLTVLVIYVIFQLGYSFGLKNQPIIDLALITAGFLLRAIAGGVACGIPLSQWFLLVAGFGSLFIVAGKRYSEIVTVGAEAGTRRSLTSYTPGFLRATWVIAATLVVISYSLWAFDAFDPTSTWFGLPWAALSIAPFTLAILSYARVIESAQAGAPEEALVRDPVFLSMGAVW